MQCRHVRYIQFHRKYCMKGFQLKIATTIILFSSLLSTNLFSSTASAQLVPEWVKNTSKWFGEGLISEGEFLNAIKYLIENDIIFLESQTKDKISKSSELIEYVIIPNGNSLQGNTGFYIPINLEVKTGTNVIWQNDDSNPHTVQSQDEDGKPSGVFNSNVLQTGDIFEHEFTNTGEFHYYCTLHPWRVGVVTVS